jgi:hypothetical protein
MDHPFLAAGIVPEKCSMEETLSIQCRIAAIAVYKSMAGRVGDADLGGSCEIFD